jgi:hypothetical protein
MAEAEILLGGDVANDAAIRAAISAAVAGSEVTLRLFVLAAAEFRLRRVDALVGAIHLRDEVFDQFAVELLARGIWGVRGLWKIVSGELR